ncbi:MAG: alanine--tRNA ligase [Verrucomicrobia bacterium]|nr:alanine--tRNA ligase [Verrucomicrobiota bacterium]
MTSSEIRQQFLDYFKRQGHTIVPSSSLLPDAPNLLFTNAGMNQFVPIFLGQTSCPYKPQRAADTQKCIRAGGKHNDLEDVGLDTYHHTFFEMLGNWSFGDYFKKEAIAWAWELVTSKEWWGFPKERLYATVYKPGPGDPSEFDQEAYDYWARIFTAAGLDPNVHIVFGNKKDNFWMMGDTGPCGPCSELHVDLTPKGDTGGKLVNKGTPQCIEIWNLVFMQFNANPDGTFGPLPAKNVDTGAGFERVCSIIQCTKNFTDFGGIISNYETDVFRPIFHVLGQLSGKRYGSTLPKAGQSPSTEQEKIDIAFRVIADHIRCLSFGIADGIVPSNEGRGYVLRRILRRAVRYGRVLGFHEPFFYKLVGVLADTMGDVFPEVRKRQASIEKTLRSEEDAFNRTLDRGILIFENEAVIGAVDAAARADGIRTGGQERLYYENEEDKLAGKKPAYKRIWGRGFWDSKNQLIAEFTSEELFAGAWRKVLKTSPVISGDNAFRLYDTYGFPLDLTELMARELGLKVDVEGFEKLMEEQRQRAREDHAKKKTVVLVAGEGLQVKPTKFLGYDNLEAEAAVEAVAPGATTAEMDVVLDKTPFYAEMGGQVGDTGLVHVPGHDRTEVGTLVVRDTQLQGEVHIHRLKLVDGRAPEVGEAVRVAVDAARRANIQRHHTVTHLFHWALHEVVSKDARQRGSMVAADRMRFDFNHPEKLSDQQIADIERLVNERIRENAPVYSVEVPYAEIKNNPKIMQFFGEKYGDKVRVVQVGGEQGKFDGFSVELCGGTHTRNTGDIRIFKIMRESAIAAGIRRVEAAVAQFALEFSEQQQEQRLREADLARQRELEKEQAKLRQAEIQKQAPAMAAALVANAQKVGDISVVIGNLGEQTADVLRAVAEAMKPVLASGIAVLGAVAEGKVSLVCLVTPDLVKRGKHAGKIVGELAKICGGGGGGRPDMAQAGGKNPAKLDEALRAVAELLKQ